MCWKSTARSVALSLVVCLIFYGEPARAIDAAELPQAQRHSHIVFGRRVVPPFAYTVFCQRTGHSCRPVPAAEGFALTAQRMDELRRVNRRINRDIAYRPDAEGGDGADHWEAHVQRGDCEDYALTKRETLIDLGWPSRRLLLALAVTEEGVGHVVVIVRLDGRDLVLDNLTDRLLPWHATSHRYLKVQSEEHPQEWHATRPGPAA